MGQIMQKMVKQRENTKRADEGRCQGRQATEKANRRCVHRTLQKLKGSPLSQKGALILPWINHKQH